MFGSVIRRYNNWKKVRRAVDELSSLSTRELNDLGITRSEIDFVARRKSD